MARRKIFAIYDGETHLGDYTAVEASQLLNIACAMVSAYANSGSRLRNRYTLEAVGDVEIDTERWAREWDQVRIEKLEWLRGGGAGGESEKAGYET